MLMRPDADSKLFFWGNGQLLAACFDELCVMLGGVPDGIVDSAEDKVGLQFRGIPCIHPNTLKKFEKPTIVISVRKHMPILASIKQYTSDANVFVVNFQMAYHKAIRLIPAAETQSQSLKLPLLKRFKGQTALVTGATKGVGLQLSLGLAEQGFNLIIVSRNEEELFAVRHNLSRFDVDIRVIATDLSTSSGIQYLVGHENIADQSVDVIYNNAGVSFSDRDCTHKALDYESMQYAFNLNVMAPIAIAEHFLRRATQEKPVRIINVTTNLESSLNTTYTITKAALNKYTFDSFSFYESNHAYMYLFDPGDVITPMNPNGVQPVSTILPAAWIPLYCKARSLSVIHAIEFSGLLTIDAIEGLLAKYPKQWDFSPV